MSVDKILYNAPEKEDNAFLVQGWWINGFYKIISNKNIENIKDKKISCEDLILQYIKK